MNEIYCYGGMEMYRDIFNAIAMLNADKSFMQTLFSITVLVGTVWAIVTMIGGDLLKPFKSWMIPMAVIQILFLTPTKTVQLIDVVQRNHATVDNVPFGLALIAGSLSRLSHKITERVEMYFSLPGELKYSKTGGIFAANLLANQKLMTIQDEDFAENMRRFIGQCVLYDVALGRKYTVKDLRHTNDIWGLISRQASPARSFLWKDPNSRGEIVTCREGVVKFNQAWNGSINQTACATGAVLFPNQDKHMSYTNHQGASHDDNIQGGCRSPLAKQEFLRFLPQHYGVLAGMAHGVDALKQQMMIAALVDAQDHASVMAGNASNFAARKAYLQQRSSYETIGRMASDTLPVMRAALELVCYGLFLFIIPLLLLPYGYKILVAWSQTILWLAMWPPMYAILHLIMISAISYRTRAYMGISNPAGITIASSLGVQNISADMAAMAGYLSMSIPFICIAIVKGVSSFVHMSSSLGAISQGAASGAASEAITGNYQMGNMSLDNHSYSNVNMLNEGYNSHLSHGSSHMQDGHVAISSSFDGHSRMNIEQSNLPVSVNVAQRISSDLRMQAQKEMSVGMSESVSAEQHMIKGMEYTASLGNHLANSKNTSHVFGEMTEQQAGQAMQKMDQAIDHLSKSANITKGQSATLMASLSSPGVAKFITGGSIGVNLESTGASQDTIAKATEIHKNFNFEENARIGMQATEHLSKGNSEDESTILARNQQKSFNEAASSNQSAQKHLEKSQRLSKEADYTQANESSVNRNFTEQLKTYIANHDAPNAYGKIGMRGAAKIIEKNGSDLEIYTDRFMQQILPPRTHFDDVDSMRQQYKATNIGPVVSNQNMGGVDRFYQQSEEKMSHEVSSKAEGIENRVQGRLEATKGLIKSAGEDVINPTWASLQKEHDRNSTNVGLVDAAKGAIKSINHALDSPSRAINEITEDTVEYLQNYQKEQKAPTDYSNVTEKLNNVSGTNTTNLVPQYDNLTDQHTKVVKIKAVPVVSDIESIEIKSGIGKRDLENKG